MTSKMFDRMTILSQTLQNAYSIYVPLLMWLQLFAILNEQGLSRNHIMLQTFYFTGVKWLGFKRSNSLNLHSLAEIGE